MSYDAIFDNLRKGLATEKGLTFLLDFERVKIWLETNPTKKTKRPLTANSLKTYYCAIKHAIKDDPTFAPVLPMYEAELSRFVKQIKVEMKEAETKQWLCWSCIENVRERLLEEFNDEPSWEVFQEYLIMCLFTLLPPKRMDYVPMR
jgi:hypothetical protein